jgi:hypothetical protein
MFDFFALSVPRETRERQASEEAAAKLGLALSYHPVMGMAGIDDALNAIRKDNCDALLVFPDSPCIASATASPTLLYPQNRRRFPVGSFRKERTAADIWSKHSRPVSLAGALCGSHPPRHETR